MKIVFAAVLILIGVIGLILFITHDLKSGRRYRNAERTTGVVTGQMEDCVMSAYGSGPANRQKRRYHQYKVAFEVEGRSHTGIVQTKENGLKPGDEIVVRYLEDENHEVEVVTRVYGDRLRELALCSVLGCLLAAVIIYLKGTGKIE